MPTDNVQTPPPAAAGRAPNAFTDERIVSVNDRGRRGGSRITPFLLMGGIVLVMLIFGLITVNIVKTRLSGPKPAATADISKSTLSRTFQTDYPPPLPGASTPVAATADQPRCADGSAGNELRGTDGVVVRNAAGQSVRVCPNGQVLKVSMPQTAAAQPVPVRTSSSGPQHAYSSDNTPMLEGQMMLNDGKYAQLPRAPDIDGHQAVLPALQAPGGAARPSAEGLLTQAPADALQAQLTPSVTPMVRASKLSDLNTLLPKGRTIDCGLSVRIISSLAGLATCVVTQNIYSANGRVLLIERGSEAVGEYRSGVSVGQKRLFVLWNRMITPGGVVINLDSPGADELGSSGLTGKVDNHWFERIGSAFLLSAVEDGIQYEVAHAQAKSGGNTFVLGNTAQMGSQVAQTVLNATINIPPTIYKNQGDRAVIYVARDLDFSSVYKLRARP